MPDLCQMQVESDEPSIVHLTPQKAVKQAGLRSLSRYKIALVAAFALTLPLVNPWVRGDGVGYYAYVHALLVRHDLDFAPEWKAGNSSFVVGRVDENGNLKPDQYTATGHVANHWSVGPSMLWAPFLVPVHVVVLALKSFGLGVNPDGFSTPYTLTMALATAFYGFIGLLLCYALACSYVEERWAFLSTVGIWFASSLPVYMYFNPSWSHAHSVFVVALFLWYWHRTRRDRTLWQWTVLGLTSGLMLDVYYANIPMLLVPLLESVNRCQREWCDRARRWRSIGRIFTSNTLYGLATAVAFLPTFITRRIIYGSFLNFGAYQHQLRWTFPMLWSVLFSSDHGLLTWTPIIVPSLVGLSLFLKYEKELGSYLIAAFLAFYVLISVDYNWDGLASFGNRFFISLTPLFVLGLSILLKELAGWLKETKAVMATAATLTCLLIVWNWAFIFQWGTHLVPARGPISWKRMAANQVTTVPETLLAQVKSYVSNRQRMMQHIEQEDLEQLHSQDR